jgi:hypothetical protein
MLHNDEISKNGYSRGKLAKEVEGMDPTTTQF